MTIQIRALQMDMMPAIQAYVEEKFQMLEKYQADILSIDVELSRESHQHKGDVFCCSANVQIPGDVLHVEKSEEDLYKAIDKVKDHLQEVLVEAKERQRALERKAAEEE
jgi:putative sigma-54 modulation protein